jgi:Tfp pilus assembly protein PilV
MTPFKARRRPGPGPAPGGAAGFTIIETVVALCIMMVVGFGSISLFLFSANYNAGASDRARSLALAQQRMEEYRAMPYSGIAVRDTTEQVNLGSTQLGKSDMHTFQVKTKVEYHDTTAGIPNNQRPWRVTITVTPQAGGRWTAGDVSLRMVRASDKFGSF